MSVRSLIVLLLGAFYVALAQWQGASPHIVTAVSLVCAAAAVVLERCAMRAFQRAMAAPVQAAPHRTPGPPAENRDHVISYDPHVTLGMYLDQVNECSALYRKCRDLEDAKEQAQVDVSNLSEGFAYRIYRKLPRAERYDPIPYEEHGTTTDPLLAATLVEQGWTAQLFPVWVLADGRVARKRSNGTPNYFTIIKEIQA